MNSRAGTVNAVRSSYLGYPLEITDAAVVVFDRKTGRRLLTRGELRRALRQARRIWNTFEARRAECDSFGHIWRPVAPGLDRCSRCGSEVFDLDAEPIEVDLGFDDDDAGPADCPGGGIDDLCSWPDIESCGLCTLGMNPDLLR